MVKRTPLQIAAHQYNWILRPKFMVVVPGENRMVIAETEFGARLIAANYANRGIHAVPVKKTGAKFQYIGESK